MSAAFLFPGQGSQTPQMLHTLPPHPAVSATLQECSDLLHTNILAFDTEAALQNTLQVQLALLAAGVATARALEAEGLIADAVAGMSLGTFSAAVHCNVLSLADAIHLVTLRAEHMHALFPQDFGLAAIIGLDEPQVTRLVAAAHTPATPVFVSNINAPRQIVIAGALQAIAQVLEAAKTTGATKAELLPVSVPSHCSLLQPVADSLRDELAKLTLHPPTKLYVGNVQPRVHRTAQAIATDLAQGISHAVRWHDATVVLEELGCTTFFEMPPGQVLTRLARQAHPDIRAIALSQTSIPYAVKLS